MKFGFSVLALTCFALATQASAQSEGGEAATENAATEEADDPSQRIRCRNQRVTGSNARRIRVCLTLAEWRELAESGNRNARNVIRSGAACPTPDAGC